ncbi:DUF3090 domain-containing protein [Solicola gregarius]|uniref:DUF3090 domain-containing protein n=1 Tax=Solicola gregarius TaxID=2908642 RepID=A0AA46YK29_9ACTN|nr:DUF3090 domain-containing protein [Solicola gregarius]UYM05022.1 DUF3090 domain-containing protein [Solicola gregarius]
MLIHRYDAPDRFVAGTVGSPGERTFFLQAREGNRLTSVTLEKQQVSVLAERVEELLAQVEQERDVDVPEDPETDRSPLDQPIEEEFRVGTMTLAWDEASGTVTIEAFALTETEDDEASDCLVVGLLPAAALSFARRAESVVTAGRDQCPFCGGPIDANGHICPRANGFRRVIRD